MSQPCLAATCTRELRDHETAAHQQLCDPCLAAVRGWLASIPNQMTVLAASRQRETTGTPTRSGSRTAPLPGAGNTLNILGPWAVGTVHDRHGDQHGPLPIAATLYAWVRLICEERRWNGPATVDETALAAWLQPHVSWAATRDWAGELHDELHGMMRAIWGITALRPRTRAVTRPCPRCDQMTLVENWGDQYVRCTDPDCAGAWTQQELCDDAAARAAA